MSLHALGKTRPLLLSAFSVLAGCDAFLLDTYWSSGDYELIAIDAKGQMVLAVDLHNGGSIGIDAWVV